MPRTNTRKNRANGTSNQDAAKPAPEPKSPTGKTIEADTVVNIVSPPPPKPAPSTTPSAGGSEVGRGPLGMEAVTLGEFAEAFIQQDTTNWFRRMKLLDHIETVQDNMQEWLDMLEKKLDGKKT